MFSISRVSSFHRESLKFSLLGGEESFVWQEPQGSSVKFNCDGALNIILNRAGVGCVMGKSNRTLLWAFATSLTKVISSVDAEGLGPVVLFALRKASSMSLKKCMF